MAVSRADSLADSMVALTALAWVVTKVDLLAAEVVG